MQQLQLRKGYVRCVNCAHIFDAYEAVVPSAPSQVGASQAPTHSASTIPFSEPSFTTSGRASPPDSEPRFVVSASDGAEPGGPVIRTRAQAGESKVFVGRDPSPAQDAADRHTLQEPGFGSHEPDRHTVGEPGFDRAPADAEDAGLYVEPRQGREGGPEFIHDERSGLGLGGVLLSVLILLGVAAALLQAAYIYRVQLASEFPGLRPALERYCESLGCTVDYPRRLAQIEIMDSSLQAVRDDQPTDDDANRMMLNVVLRNNYDRPQQWPTLSVDLVDFSGTVALRRLLAPADYLPALSQERPFPASSEVRVSVPITVQGVQINGYQLDRFFP